MANTLLTDILAALTTGPKTSRELVGRLKVSQPTLSRALSVLGDQLVVLGRGRATRYARPRPIRGFPGPFPAYRIGTDGSVQQIGSLHALVGGGYWWQAEDGDSESRYCDHLPWFVQDMRPDGFIGRAFAQRHQRDLGLPEKLTEWSDDDVLIALTRRGEDHVGNLLLGNESLERYLRSCAQPLSAIATMERTSRYPELATLAQAGEPPGSSAGGEQPKFTALIADGTVLRHVLVKFSPPLAQTDGRRWGDLLLCEHLALQIIAESGIAAASTRIVTSERLFLEVERFDRSGWLGRSALFSLRALDGAFVGSGGDWLSSATALQRAGAISAADARQMRWLKIFGEMIANSDMHAGNLSFQRVAAGRYALAPVYDMLPMLYRPLNGELIPRDFTPPMPTAETGAIWSEVLPVAQRFWDAAASNAEVSAEFRVICGENREKLRALERVPAVVGRR